jgi:hypothetical protein
MFVKGFDPLLTSTAVNGDTCTCVVPTIVAFFQFSSHVLFLRVLKRFKHHANFRENLKMYLTVRY